jgi:hypothetical protein
VVVGDVIHRCIIRQPCSWNDAKRHECRHVVQLSKYQILANTRSAALTESNQLLL